MEYLGEKIIKLQDAKFKTLQNNSNEASIFITGDLAEKLKLIENTKAKFKIEKSDLIKLLCFTFSFKGTIYKKEKITLDLKWFDKYLTLINNHYEKSSEFSFDITKQSQERFYFIGLEQTSGLNIRDLFIQDHIKLLFYKGETDLIKIECSNEIYHEIESDKRKIFPIEDNVLRQFALKSLRYIINEYGESFLDRSNKNVTESVTSDSIPYKTYLFPDYFTQGLLFSFEAEPNKNDSRSTPRFINENLNILGQKFIYLTTEWAYSGTSNLLFSQLVKFIEEYTNNEYTAIRNGEKGSFLLIKKLSQSNVLFDLSVFQEKSQAAGLIFSPQLIQRFIASLCTKPFIICSGLSGSGKTKLAQAFAQWITSDESQYVIVPVGADWTNREPLLGYPNALNKEEYVCPENGVLDLMLRAKQNIENTEEPIKPYFLILDEMNLSHVERYFADFLSTMESGDKIPLHKIENDSLIVPPSIKLPKNLFIVGTVNIDETTYMFSPKVLDRANTIEFRLTEKDLADFIESDLKLDMELLKAQGANMSGSFMTLALQETDKNLKPSEADLKLFFSELKKSGAEFGYRTASEIGRLMYMLKELGESGDNLFDIAIMQKLLPKLHGSRNKLTKVLPILGGFCLTDNSKIKEDYLDKFLSNSLTEAELKADTNIKYKISFEKICRMYKNAVENGFASYAEA
ncbi:McrB family protein [Flavobacterium sp.]|uniref:McrB family protein n=1 Tax=Flavobacterium sp. TaxID=239 RepID=UPI0037500AE5